jgi:hypothetical protein
MPFRETQRFRQPWVWVILVSITGFNTFIAATKDAPWWGAAVPAVVLVLFAFLTLTTEVRDGKVKASFGPFARREFDVRDIENAEAITYRPLRDYGGWGIRRGRKGWAFNVSGNRGVLLHLRDGKTLMIGSQRSEELAAAIDAERNAP